VAAAQQEIQQLRQQPQQREIEEKERRLVQLREQLQQLQQSSIRQQGQLREQYLLQQKLVWERDEARGQQQEIVRERDEARGQQQRLVREREEAQGQMRQQLHQLQQKLVKEKERQVEQLLAAHREEIEQIIRAKDERERQLEDSKLERNAFEKQLHEFEKELLMWRDGAKYTQHLKAAATNVHIDTGKRDNIKLRWREGRSALFASKRWSDAIVDRNRVYLLDDNSRLWTYGINNKRWLQLSKAPYQCAGFVILDGLPTTVGGDITNKLMSLTLEGKWTEKFPPMPTQRRFVSAACTETDLIVAGGVGKDAEVLLTVEVLNIEDRQWSTAVDLPEPLQCQSATVSGDQLYMLGGAHGHVLTKSVYTCSVSALLRTCTQRSVGTQRSLVGSFKRALSLSSSSSDASIGVWSKLPDLPVIKSTCVTFYGQLLAVGGMDSDKPTTAVYTYNQITNSWNVIGLMTTARRGCFAVLLPNNQLMVVGGETEIDHKWADSDLVEFGNLC
jgi:hypothetical protein